MSALRVVLVDDHPVVLSGLSALLQEAPDMDVVGVATTGGAALRLLAEKSPDLAVVDLRLPDMEGTELSRRMLLTQPRVRIVVLTMHSDDDLVVEALAAGASAFMLKDAPPEDVLNAIRQAARGHLVLAAGVRAAVAGPLGASAARDLTTLSRREREVLELLARGHTTTDIAHRLGLAPKTVRNRLSEVYAKLDVTDRAAAVAVARDAGLATPRRDASGQRRDHRLAETSNPGP